MELPTSDERRDYCYRLTIVPGASTTSTRDHLQWRGLPKLLAMANNKRSEKNAG